MKKKIFLACLIGILSLSSAYSYTGECKGGTIVAGFCKSNVQMNWWSAQAWCQANGSQLPTMYEMCPSWDGNGGAGKCPELNKGLASQHVWSATAQDSIYAFTVDLLDGEVYPNARYYSMGVYGYAFCR